MASINQKTAHDRELHAMGAILRALDGLDGESIRRVLDYVFNRLSISGPSPAKATTSIATPAPSLTPPDTPHHSKTISIRDLKDEKQPESANQMAALVAYYLSEVATDDSQKAEVNSADLEKYFKQAGFKLPKALPQTLANATAAGYFDSVGNGLYKLNPVGYNLVVHALPRPHATPRAKKNRAKVSRKRRS
jgi:hypothetical protein